MTEEKSEYSFETKFNDYMNKFEEDYKSELERIKELRKLDKVGYMDYKTAWNNVYINIYHKIARKTKKIERLALNIYRNSKKDIYNYEHAKKELSFLLMSLDSLDFIFKKDENKFEIRIDDRNPPFKNGDLLWLKEYDPKLSEEKQYSGREILCKITFIINDVIGDLKLVRLGYATMSLEIIERTINNKSIWRIDLTHKEKRMFDFLLYMEDKLLDYIVKEIGFTEKGEIDFRKMLISLKNQLEK
ncbi:MAG: DUF3850 domain-containing protein [Candidatus Thorarchaeota archaeon]